MTLLAGARPSVCLTAYTTPMARLLDAHADLLLVGDSVGMVLYGFDSTRFVTLEMMRMHTAAVRRGASRAMVVADLPFGTYDNAGQALEAASQLVHPAGADAVKLEGGCEVAPVIESLTQHGIAVMAHIGLLPQQVTSPEGFRAVRHTPENEARLLADLRAVTGAGAFAVVLEAIEESLARILCDAAAIPTIGIGASPACDGQILVTEDLLGLNAGARLPKFVKTYANLSSEIERAVSQFARDVRQGDFPGEAQLYGGLSLRKKIS